MAEGIGSGRWPMTGGVAGRSPDVGGHGEGRIGTPTQGGGMGRAVGGRARGEEACAGRKDGVGTADGMARE